MTITAPTASTDDLNLKPDGRLLRSERSRHLIVEATTELIDEGVLTPTAQQVAKRANVGIRSVFRHFDDMDSIFEHVETQPQYLLIHMYVKSLRCEDKSKVNLYA